MIRRGENRRLDHGRLAVVGDGLMCLMALGLLLLLIVLIVVQRGGSRRPLSDIEKDYDERPRRRER